MISNNRACNEISAAVEKPTPQTMRRAGCAKGVCYASPRARRYNYTLNPYFMDGLRAMIFLAEESVSYDEIDWQDRETPLLGVEWWHQSSA